MPRMVASLLAVSAVAWLAASPVLPAQAGGAVAGRLVDAAGQALRDVTVGLFAAEGGTPVGGALQTGVTDPLGAWAFSGVTPGEYVVQGVLGEVVFGVPVTVGSTLSAGVLIVAPSAAVAAAGAAVAGAGTGAGAGTAAAGAGTAAAGAGAAAAGVTGLQAGLLAAGIGGAVATTSAVVFRPDQS